MELQRIQEPVGKKIPDARIEIRRMAIENDNPYFECPGFGKCPEKRNIGPAG
jgi:hypothetical protein